MKGSFIGQYQISYQIVLHTAIDQNLYVLSINVNLFENSKINSMREKTIISHFNTISTIIKSINFRIMQSA